MNGGWVVRSYTVLSEATEFVGDILDSQELPRKK